MYDLLVKYRDRNSRLTLVRASFLRRGSIEGPGHLYQDSFADDGERCPTHSCCIRKDLYFDIFAIHMAVFRLEALSRQLGRHGTDRGLPEVVHDVNEMRPTDLGQVKCTLVQALR